MKKIYTEESKTPPKASPLNSPKNKEDKQISLEKKLLPQEVVVISNQPPKKQLGEKIYDQKLVSNIQTNPQEAKVNYLEAKKLYVEIGQDIHTSTISMQNMKNQLINCTFQRQLGQISDEQAQGIIYGILPDSVAGIELLNTTAEKLETLETLCSKLNSLAGGDMPEYNIAQFSIEYTKSSIKELQNCFQENLNIVDEMDNKLQK